MDELYKEKTPIARKEHKMREKLSEFVRLNEVAYGGNDFEWIEKENKDARN